MRQAIMVKWSKQRRDSSLLCAGRFARVIVIGCMLAFAGPVPAKAGDISPVMQQKIEAYKEKIREWAAYPEIVEAVKQSNAKGPIPGMANLKWEEVKTTDPLVRAFINSLAGQLLTRWMNDNPNRINKIVLSGNRSHRVAFTSKPLLYIGKGRPNFDVPFFEGKVWQQNESKPDPSTGIDTVQVTVPVKDEQGRVIGVLLVSLSAASLQSGDIPGEPIDLRRSE